MYTKLRKYLKSRNKSKGWQSGQPNSPFGSPFCGMYATTMTSAVKEKCIVVTLINSSRGLNLVDNKYFKIIGRADMSGEQ